MNTNFSSQKHYLSAILSSLLVCTLASAPLFAYEGGSFGNSSNSLKSFGSGSTVNQNSSYGQPANQIGTMSKPIGSMGNPISASGSNGRPMARGPAPSSTDNTQKAMLDSNGKPMGANQCRREKARQEMARRQALLQSTKTGYSETIGMENDN